MWFQSDYKSCPYNHTGVILFNTQKKVKKRNKNLILASKKEHLNHAQEREEGFTSCLLLQESISLKKEAKNHLFL